MGAATSCVGLELYTCFAEGDTQLRVVMPGLTNWGDETAPEIFGDTLMTDDFAIGTGNAHFDPHFYGQSTQLFSIVFKSIHALNQIECYQPFWSSNRGEDAWYQDRSSPFQQMMRYDQSSVVMLFDIPKADPWGDMRNNAYRRTWGKHHDALLQVVTCRFPRSMDQIVVEKNWVFARHGNMFVAMATLNGDNEYDNTTPE